MIQIFRILSTCCLFLLGQLPAFAQVILTPLSFETLTFQEEELAKQLRLIKDQHKSSADLYEKIESFQTADEATREQFLQDWFAVHSSFHSNIDVYIKNQQQYFLELSFSNLSQVGAKVLKGKNKAVYRQDYVTAVKAMQTEHDTFYKLLEGFGTAKDYQRINAFVRYFHHFQTLARTTGLIPIMAEPYMGKLKSVIVKYALSHPGIFYSIFKPHSGKSKLRPKTKIILKERTVLQHVCQKMGIDVQVKGQENIPYQRTDNLQSNKDVNVFVFMHADPFFDEIVKAYMPLPHMMIVWALAAAPLPAAMKRSLAQSPSIIPVGGGKSTLETALDHLRKGYSNNIAIHPQGQLGLFNEIMPLHTTFAHKFIKGLKDAGYRVSIIPVSSHYAPVFVASHIDRAMQSPGGHKIDVTIHRGLTDPQLNTLLRSPLGYDLVNHYIRSVWLENSVNNDSQLMGQWRSAAVVKKMQTELGITLREDAWLQSLPESL